MRRTGDELQLIREQMMRVELRIVAWLQAHREINPMVEQRIDQVCGIAWFDGDDVFGKTFFELAQHCWQ